MWMPARIRLPRHLANSPFSVTTGIAAGLTPKRMRGPDLHRPYYGIRAAQQPTSVHELAGAFAHRMPEHAFFCSITAAIIMRVPLPLQLESSRTLHVGVPAPARSLRSQKIVGHKLQIEPGDLRLWHGLRITTPERTWCDLSVHLELPDLVAAGDFLIHCEFPFTTRSQLQDAVARHPGRRGKAHLHHALEYLDDAAESPQESRLRVIIVQAGIPGIVANLRITTSGGYRYRADLSFPDSKTIIEYQSDYHNDMEQFRRDMTRRGRLEADGWFVMLVNANDLHSPAELVQRIRAVLASRPRTR